MDEPLSTDAMFTDTELDLMSQYHRLRELPVDTQVEICVLMARLFREGPSSFREQAEAKAADCFGDEVAGKLVGRTP